MSERVVVAVVIILGTAYALTVVATAGRHGRMNRALEGLPARAQWLGLDYDDSDPPNDVVQGFLAFDQTRNQTYFNNDAFAGVVTGTFRDVPITAFAYWYDIDGVHGYTFVGTSQLPKRCPTVLVSRAGWFPEPTDLSAVPFPDAELSPEIEVWGRDAAFARSLLRPDVCRFVQDNVRRGGDPRNRAFSFVVEGDRVFASWFLPDDRDELESQFLTLLAFKDVVTRALQRDA